MNKKPVLLAVIVLAVAALSIWAYKKAGGKTEPTYRFATVERGDLEAAVSATGTLSAVTTVQVGTQVSGKIVAINVDFNDRVKKGELIARIDPTLLQQAVRDAQAGLERNQAELEQAEREYERNEKLFQSKVLTEIEFNTAKYALAVARANVKSAQVTLDRARQNLSYTEIYAPIDGIVVERNVDVGQTVVASMSTPQLFLIANDLAQMQILASVDESDIGSIHDGQSVRFSVQAYPNRQFTGEVKQVRLQSKTTENVVNYTVVVRVSNSSGNLLPGMTATLEFLTGSASNVLLVPNSALRFRPTEEMRAEVRKRQQPGGNAAGGTGEETQALAIGQGSAPVMRPGDAGGGFAARQGGGANEAVGAPAASGGGPGAPSGAPGANGAFGHRSQPPQMLWYLDDAGKLAVTRVRAGITDGQRTEVTSPKINEGMRVIIAVSQPTAGVNDASPFGGPPNRGGRRFGGF